MKKESNFKESGFDKNIIDLVIARIEAQMPSDLKLCIGDEEGGLSGAQMIKHIKEGDEIGVQIVRSHLNFMKAQSNGELTSALNSVL